MVVASETPPTPLGAQARRRLIVNSSAASAPEHRNQTTQNTASRAYGTGLTGTSLSVPVAASNSPPDRITHVTAAQTRAAFIPPRRRTATAQARRPTTTAPATGTAIPFVIRKNQARPDGATGPTTPPTAPTIAH